MNIISILKAHKLLGKPTYECLVEFAQDILVSLPQTATKTDINKFIKDKENE